MFRNKEKTMNVLRILFALILCLSLIMSQKMVLADSELIEGGELTDETINYKTAVASYGDLTSEGKFQTETYFPKKTSIRYFGEKVNFEESLISYGQEVKVGDPVLRYSLDRDDALLKESELRVLRAKEAYEEGKLQKETAIEALRTELQNTWDTYGQQKLNLRIQIEELKLSQYCYEQEYMIQGLEDSYEELQKKYESQYIYATGEGKVVDFVRFSEGDVLYDGMEVCTLRQDDVILIRVGEDSEDESYFAMAAGAYRRGNRVSDTLLDASSLRYGQTCTITSRHDSNKTQFTGRVIVSPDAVDGSGFNGALIMVLDDAPEEYLRNVSMSAPLIDLQNVLLIPNEAKTNINGKIYVSILDENNVIHERPVTIGLIGNKYSWVIEGLSEGDVVILK